MVEMVVGLVLVGVVLDGLYAEDLVGRVLNVEEYGPDRCTKRGGNMGIVRVTQN